MSDKTKAPCVSHAPFLETKREWSFDRLTPFMVTAHRKPHVPQFRFLSLFLCFFALCFTLREFRFYLVFFQDGLGASVEHGTTTPEPDAKLYEAFVKFDSGFGVRFIYNTLRTSTD